MEERGMSGIKDVDLKILMEMDDRELLTICNSKNKYFHRICKDELFWQQRYMKRFASIKKEAADHKPTNQTWRQYYLQTVIDLDRFSNDPWQFLPFVLWSPKGIDFSKYRDKEGEVIPFNEAPSWVMNNFFLLNLGPITTIDGVFYESVTPYELFNEISRHVPENYLINGSGILKNRDLYQR